VAPHGLEERRAIAADLALAQISKLFVRQPQLAAENLVVVLAQRLRRARVPAAVEAGEVQLGRSQRTFASPPTPELKTQPAEARPNPDAGARAPIPQEVPRLVATW
jgi:hypothetical protein